MTLDLTPISNILFWLFMFFYAWNVYIVLFNKGVPNIRTAPAIRKKIIELLKADFAARGQTKSPYIIYDLGSGNGLITREIARALPGAKVIGIEADALARRWANYFKDKQKIANLEYRDGNFYEADLSEAAAVVFYLTSMDMARMGEKLMRELAPGTLVTSNRFELSGGWKPTQTLDIFTLYPHQRRLNVYKKQSLTK